MEKTKAAADAAQASRARLATESAARVPERGVHMIRNGFALLLLFPLPLASAADPAKLTLTLRETAGIRRFSYPVSATLAIPAADAKSCRLLENGKPIPAQFGPHGDKQVIVDFIASPGPFESKDYFVEHGQGVEPGPA